MQKLTYILLILALIPLASALTGNNSAGNDIRFSTGYITFNSTGSSTNVQSFGDYISHIVKDSLNFLGWFSQLDYNFFSPESVELNFPLNNSFFNHTTTFDWSNTTDTEKFDVSYLFEIYNDSSITQIGFVNYTITETENTTSTIPDATFEDGDYYWRVAANDSSKNGTFSTERLFTIDTTLPANFNLTTPADATSSTDTTPTLEWDSSTDTYLDNYTIEISTLTDFSTITQIEVSESASLNNYSTPLDYGTYYWRVSAVDNANNQRQSDNNLSFIVQASQTQTVTSGSSGTVSSGGGSSPFTLNIIAPEGITLKENDIVTIPLLVINPSSLRLRGIDLKISSDNPNIQVSLDKTSIQEIDPDSQERLLLTVNTQNIIAGTYGITIDASVSSPIYKDQFKIFANLLEKDLATSPEVSEQIDFAKQLFNGNPACLDLSEFITEAELAAQNGDNSKALSLAENAIEACNNLLRETGNLNFITSQAIFMNKIKSRISSRTFLIIAPQALGLLILSLTIMHFVRKRKH